MAKKAKDKVSGTLEGYVGVDSGQVMIVDPCYVIRDDAEYEKLGCSDEYQAIRSVRHPITGLGCGVIVRSGYGDGCYPVAVKLNREGRVKSVTVTFIAEGD